MASGFTRAIRHLVETRAPYGTYNVTGSWPVTTWADIARQVFTFAGHDPNRVTSVSTDEYFASTDGPVAPRPENSVLDLAKIVSTGYLAADADETLLDYLRQETLTM